MVEVNCETDFVARNEKFKSLVSQAAKECASGATPLLEHGLKKVTFSCMFYLDLENWGGGAVK